MSRKRILFINDEPVNELKVITKKPDPARNSRARSAKLRIAEKVMMV
ncbi:MAG: hypothetical protein WDO16_07965 [Bacteroidota bacterium]